MFKFNVLLMTIVLALVACSDSITNPTPESFSLQITVTDAAGQPVEGLRVDAWNMLSPPPLRAARLNRASIIPPPDSFALRPAYPNPFVASTSVELDLPVLCDYEFRVFDLTGRQVDSQVTSGADAGTYTMVLAPATVNLTAYMIRVQAYDSTQTYLVDTTYAACWSSVPEENTMGTTGVTGELQTRDSLRFPALYDVPAMVYKTETDSTRGSFGYVDSIEIQLRDVVNNLQQTYSRPLTRGSNSVTLVW